MIERFHFPGTVVPKSFGPEVSGLYNSCIRGEKRTADSFQQTAVLSILLEFKNHPEASGQTSLIVNQIRAFVAKS
jgi:hypothetical protein